MEAAAQEAPWLLLIPLGIFVPRLAAQHPDWIEAYYSEKIYPFISAWMGKLNSFTRASLAECILFALVITVAVLTLVYLYRLLFRRIRFSAFVGYLLSLCIAGGVLLNLFYVMWGFNYFRPSLYTLLTLPVEERSTDDWRQHVYALRKKQTHYGAKCVKMRKAYSHSKKDTRPTLTKFRPHTQRLAVSFLFFPGCTYAAKGVASSIGLSYAGISGIFIPHTGEANVNVDQPALLMLSAAAHETAHYLGIAREDEANFASYLACTHSQDPSISYSGTMLALIHCGNKLYAADKEKYSALYATYNEGVVRDLGAIMRIGIRLKARSKKPPQRSMTIT